MNSNANNGIGTCSNSPAPGRAPAPAPAVGGPAVTVASTRKHGLVEGNGGAGKKRRGIDKDDAKKEILLRYFPCILVELDAAKYRECDSYRLADANRIKQHLERCHLIREGPDYGPYCPNCRQIFPSDTAGNDREHNEHVRAGNCRKTTFAETGKLLPEEYKALMKLKLPKGNELERCVCLFQELIKDAPVPTSFAYQHPVARFAKKFPDTLLKGMEELGHALDPAAAAALKDLIRQAAAEYGPATPAAMGQSPSNNSDIATEDGTGQPAKGTVAVDEAPNHLHSPMAQFLLEDTTIADTEDLDTSSDGVDLGQCAVIGADEDLIQDTTIADTEGLDALPHGAGLGQCIASDNQLGGPQALPLLPGIPAQGALEVPPETSQWVSISRDDFIDDTTPLDAPQAATDLDSVLPQSAPDAISGTTQSVAPGHDFATQMGQWDRDSGLNGTPTIYLPACQDYFSLSSDEWIVIHGFLCQARSVTG